jgi:hypothetical protein
MSSIELKMAFDDALIEEMRDYRRKICMYRFGYGYNKLDDVMQEIINEEVGKAFAGAVRDLVNTGDPKGVTSR